MATRMDKQAKKKGVGVPLAKASGRSTPAAGEDAERTATPSRKKELLQVGDTVVLTGCVDSDGFKWTSLQKEFKERIPGVITAWDTVSYCSVRFGPAHFLSLSVPRELLRVYAIAIRRADAKRPVPATKERNGTPKERGPKRLAKASPTNRKPR